MPFPAPGDYAIVTLILRPARGCRAAELVRAGREPTSGAIPCPAAQPRHPGADGVKFEARGPGPHGRVAPQSSSMASAAASSASAATRPPSNCSNSMSSWPRAPGFVDALRERVAKVVGPAPHLVRAGPAGRDRRQRRRDPRLRIRQGLAAGRPARRGRDREPHLRHRRRDAAAAAAAADRGDVVQPEPRHRQRRAGARAPAAHAPGPHRPYRLRAWPGNRDPRLGLRAAVALAAGGDRGRGKRRPDRLAARRRGPGGRHHAVAGDRTPAARRRVPRAPRSAGRQRAPADADRRRCAAFRRAAHLADPRPAASPAQLRVALRRPARARAAARHRVRAHRPARRARSGRWRASSG